MKYKKLLKKAAVSLLLAQSLIFTGLPIQAADIAGQSMVWTESVEMESAGEDVYKRQHQHSAGAKKGGHQTKSDTAVVEPAQKSMQLYMHTVIRFIL